MALNSWQFLLLAVVAVLTVPLVTGWARVGLFLCLNSVFVWSYWGAAGMPIALGYCLAGYVCARLVRGRGTRVLIVCIGTLTASFVALRGYQLGGRTGVEGAGAAAFMAFAGLSFLFFKMVHVVVDSASGTIERLTLRHYMNYCLNFTTVLMGPIQRYQDFVSQWDNQSPAGFEENVDGVNRVLRGLLKAFVLAPFVAPHVLQHGVSIESLGAGELLLQTFGFYVFLYLDFSGYCDIMIGVASLMGFRLPENFDFPFLSRNVSEYWLRVHRSLTLWLTDYVFNPAYRSALQGRLLGAHPFLALAASLVLTMFIAGLWHGTSLSFAAFGLIHGTALVVVRGYEHLMVRWMGRARFRRLDQAPVVRVAATALTYGFTSLAYVFFVLDIGEAIRLFGRLGVTVMGLAR